MYMIPQSVPISSISKEQAKVLAMLDDGPTMLMQRATPVAIMVTPDSWNETAQLIASLREELARERRLRISNQRYARMSTEPDYAISQEEFEAMS